CKQFRKAFRATPPQEIPVRDEVGLYCAQLTCMMVSVARFNVFKLIDESVLLIQANAAMAYHRGVCCDTFIVFSTHRCIRAGCFNSVARIEAAQLKHQASMNLKNYCCLVLQID
ncbi:hypothetical protein Tco_1095509, partial [Tanacetum coccineum]